MYGPRLCSYVRPQTPVTYEQDNCRANTPTDKDKDSCQYTYERDNCRANTPTEYEPRCWHYTATRTTPSLVPYYYLHRQPIVPICLRSTDQLIDEPVLNHYYYRHWYRTTTRTDRCHACS